MKIGLQMIFTLLLEVIQAEDGEGRVRQENFLGQLLRILLGRKVFGGVLDDWLNRWQLNWLRGLLVFSHH